MVTSRTSYLVGNQRPQLTLHGALILLVVFLTMGPTVAYAIGIPMDFMFNYVRYLLFGKASGMWGAANMSFWGPLGSSIIFSVIGLPFYGWWADTNLWQVTVWIACCVILVASFRGGISIGDASVIGASAVLAFPFLVDPDGPHLTWGYPDAVFMAGAAAGGAAFCTAIVLGLGEAGKRKRVEWGWLAKADHSEGLYRSSLGGTIA